MGKFLNNNRKLVLSSSIFTAGFIAILAAVMFHLSNSESPVVDSQFKPAKSAQSNYNMPVVISFNTAEKYPGLPVVPVSNPVETISQLISAAEEDIYIAIYSMNMPELKPMIKQAYDRGVKIHIVYDELKADNLYGTFGEDIKTYETYSAPSFPDIRQNRQRSLMHHKFILVDPDNQSKATVFTGTLNLTNFQLAYDPSNSVTIKDFDIAQGYKEEFTRISKGLHGTNKPLSIHYQPFSLYKKFADGSLELWFSPRTSDSAFSERIKELIRQSKKSIYFVDWYFSDEEITKELYKKHLEGVEIKGIVDDNNIWLKGSVVPNMLGLYQHNTNTKVWEPPLINIISDFFRNSKFQHNFSPQEEQYKDYYSFLHQHNMIIDEKIVITGAGNWTDAADQLNDEDGFVIENEKITKIFLNNFWNNYLSLGGIDEQNEWLININKIGDIKITKSSATQTSTSLKIISVSMPYKRTFEESIIAESSITLAANENSLSLPGEISDQLIHNQQQATEIYLLDNQDRLLSRAYFLPSK